MTGKGAAAPSDAAVEAATLRWLERAVIGLNLCPFARAVYVRGQLRCAVSGARTDTEVLADLQREVGRIAAADPVAHDTTLLVVPQALADFLDFNDVAARGDRLLRRLRLDSELQLATFHPQYRFAEAETDGDIGNWTNRAPYPTLHLLREASVARAVDAMPDTSAIYRDNIRTLQRLGPDGWAALGVGPAEVASNAHHGA